MERSEGDMSADIGALVSDSFSDIPSDDSNSWMQKIDVSNFKELTHGEMEDDRSDSEHGPFLLDHGGYASRRVAPPALAVHNSSLAIKSEFPSPADSLNSPALRSDVVTTTSEMGDGKEDRPNSSDFVAETAISAGRSYPKPSYSYSCLIALALKNSKIGRLTVAEIYNFMCENFPYFRNAPNGWKNSVRHNLSLNKCFQKIELEAPGGHGRKSCLWMLNPQKVSKMDQEIRKWRERDPTAVKESLACAEDLEMIEKGLKGLPGDFVPHYMFGSLPEMSTSGNPHLLLVKTSHLQSVNRFIRQTSTDASLGRWSHAPKMARLAVPNPPKTPPLVSAAVRSRSLTIPADAIIADSVSAAAARNLQAALQQQSPSTFSTPQRPSQPMQHQQSSPFSQTPPYSPNVPSPQMKPSDWSTPRHDLAYSPPYALGSPQLFSYGQYSPCHQNAPNPYDTAASALNNNSLLQSALAQSPCRGPALTFQTL